MSSVKKTFYLANQIIFIHGLTKKKNLFQYQTAF
jgi:hypothetical protein